MKSYEEMIQFIVYNKREGIYRYQSGAMALAVSEAYGMQLKVVYLDIEIEESLRDRLEREACKAEQKTSNEARRLANESKRLNDILNVIK